jgi:hypothetical protein
MPVPQANEQSPSLTQGVHCRGMPATQGPTPVLVPLTSLQVPAQPLHERTRGCTPDPHVVLQVPATFHAVHVFCTPASHGPGVVSLPTQLSAQPVQ